MRASHTKYFFAFAAIAASLAAVWLHSTVYFLDPGRGSVTASLTWLLSIALLFACGRGEPANGGDSTPRARARLSRTQKIAVAVSLAAGLFLRCFYLREAGLCLDEWYWLTEAKKILTGQLTTPFGFIGDQPSNIQAWALAPFVWAIKDVLIAVRLPGVFYGFGTLGFVYLTLRDFFSLEAAISACALFAFSLWDIHNVQQGFHNIIVVPFLISGTIYFLIRSQNGYRRSDLVACGFFAGMAFNTLYVAAVIAGVVAVVWARELVTGRRAALRGGAWLALAFLVTAAPTFPKLIRYPSLSLGQTSKFVEHNLGEGKHDASYYVEQTMLLLEDFATHSDRLSVPAPWGIQLDYVELSLFLLGLAVGVLKYRERRFLPLFAGLAAFGVVMIVLFRFTSLWREYGMFPFILVFGALGWAELETVLLSRRARSLAAPALALACFAAVQPSFAEWRAFRTDRLLYSNENIYGQVAKALGRFVREGYEIEIVDRHLAYMLISMQLPASAKLTELPADEPIRTLTSEDGRKVRVEVYADREDSHPPARFPAKRMAVFRDPEGVVRAVIVEPQLPR